jgi:TrpR-related protein YerC/YecD
MRQNIDTIWQDPKNQQLIDVIDAIKNKNDMMNFLRDVMTEKEIIEISSRLEAARMLQLGNIYTDIINRTKLSSRTIARISKWMKNGMGGYVKALEIINNHHNHIQPARTE